MSKFILGILVCVFIVSCSKPDNKKLIGRWQCDDEWHEYAEDNTYSSGRSVITMVKGFKYEMDLSKKELIMYTDDEKQTYYLQYKFIGEDTLMLNNILNTTPRFNKFYRVKKNENQ